MSSDVPPEQGEIPPTPPEYTTQVETNKDARTFAVLAHLLGIFTSFIGPLIIWLLKKDEHPFVDDQAKEAMNFQITILLLHLVSGLLWCVLIGIATTGIIAVVQIVLGIVASMKANQGWYYRYPLCLRLIS